MKTTLQIVSLSYLLTVSGSASQPALTIYNQDFAVVRDTVPLNLKSGVNEVSFTGATAYLEPSSVVLRDSTGKAQLQILEQNYRADTVSQEMLLTLNEGKTIQFEVVNQLGGQTKRELISGKIIRSGSGVAPGAPYWYGPGMVYGGAQPVIEVEGKLRFSLPGQPLFPALTDDSILKPTLFWVVQAEQPAKLDAELSYVTGGLSWEADYNLVLPEKGDSMDMIGWVTIDNQSGNSFKQARIKLMAGDVNKMQNVGGFRRQGGTGGGMGGGGAAPPVTEKMFDDYHLYQLERSTTLLDHEKKQVEFVQAAGVKSEALYIYDGAATDPDQSWVWQGAHYEPEYGTQSSKKVWVMREFINSAANHLGLPLPKGLVRFYRRDTDGQMEFTGENTIKHTPRDEVIRLYTGNAFDLVGERKQTDFQINIPNGPDGRPLPAPPGAKIDPEPWIDESYEIKLRNHKPNAVEIRVNQTKRRP
ncbi:MAG: hypothetical protein NT154_36985 [Verrucomicrobia bacterium]|nr:hypothetical protein [Verrucomicrobiota bacterium]